MRKNLFLWAVFAVMMALAGCTQKEIVYVEKEDGTGSEMQLEGNVLKISLSNGLSRAVRPIYDNTADNNINRIGLRFFEAYSKTEIDEIKIEKVVASTNIIQNETDREDAEKEGSTDEQDFYENNIIKIGGTDGYTTTETIEIHLNMDTEKAKGKNIRIIAYGYNDGTGSENFPTSTAEYGDSGYDGPVLGLDNVTNDDVQEYFAGSVDTYVNDFGLFDVSPTVELKRQVAGLLVYLEKVPVYVNKAENEPVKVCSITVNAAKYMKGLLIPANQMTGDRKKTGSSDSKNNYANGLGVESSSNGEVLLTFDLKQQGITDKGTYYQFPQNSTVGGTSGKNKVLFAEEMKEIASQFSGKEFANHTLFGSCFILPFDNANYSPTIGKHPTALAINYLDEDGDVIKRVDLYMSPEAGPSTSSYAIWANHFYSIGYKNGDAAEDSDGDGYPDDGEGNPTDSDGDGEPDNPAGDQDKPLDISDPSGTKILKLTVNDTWEDVSLIRPAN